VGSVLAIVLLAVFVSESASDREPEAAPAAAIDPMNIEALRQRVEADPTNVEARLDLAQSLVIAGEVAGAESQIEAVLARAPDHPRALSYAALVRFARGDLPGAVAAAERSIELDPSNPEPRVHLAIILAQIGETGRAAAVLDEAIRLFPGDASALERLRAEILGPGAPAASGNVTVEIDAPPDAASRRGTLFVVLRPAADAPPIAIRREPISTFPVRVEITPADLMEGDAFPASMVVEARLDADGLFATTAAGDLSGSVGDITPGSVARIVLHP
ncbi:MAG: tetratricopeptide repeat protein, partial [Thermoanaerobaculia bacterium]